MRAGMGDRRDAVDRSLVAPHKVDLFERPLQALLFEAGERDGAGRRVTGARDALGCHAQSSELSGDVGADLVGGADQQDVRDARLLQGRDRFVGHAVGLRVKQRKPTVEGDRRGRDGIGDIGVVDQQRGRAEARQRLGSPARLADCRRGRVAIHARDTGCANSMLLQFRIDVVAHRGRVADDENLLHLQVSQGMQHVRWQCLRLGQQERAAAVRPRQITGGNGIGQVVSPCQHGEIGSIEGLERHLRGGRVPGRTFDPSGRRVAVTAR